MLIINSLVCMVRKHAFSPITYKGSPYQYCLQCGKLEPSTVNGSKLFGKEVCL
jgi:hypothetical protein